MMRVTKRKKDKGTKVIKRCLVLATLIGVLTLSYKGYEHYSSKIVQANNTVATDKIKTTNDTKIDTASNEENYKEDSSVVKASNVSSKGQRYTYDAEKVKDILDNKKKNDGEKIVFLTFDDGPSVTVTPKILNVLKDYDVKATFCLIGREVNGSEGSKRLVKRTFEEGHALVNHTYSHDLKNLYPQNKTDVECFMEEVEKTNTVIRNIVGQDFNTRVLRMPGGYMSRKYYKDPNLEELDAKLKEKGIYSIDWNAYDFDSEGKKKNAAELVEEVKKSVGTEEKVVLLMHDTYGKEETAKALPQIIEYLKSQGYKFRTMS